MIGRGKAGLLLPAVLVVAGGAAVWAAYSWLQTPVNATQIEGDIIEAQNGEIDALSEELEFSMPPISAYDAILNRPIFAPSRRAVAGSPKAVIMNQELGVELLGFAGDPSDPRILLKPTDGGETVSLRIGEDFRGWVFSELKEDSAIFRNDADDEEILELNYEKAPTVTAKSRRDKRRKQAQQAQKQRQRQQTGAVEEDDEDEEDEDDQPAAQTQ